MVSGVRFPSDPPKRTLIECFQDIENSEIERKNIHQFIKNSKIERKEKYGSIYWFIFFLLLNICIRIHKMKFKNIYYLKQKYVEKRHILWYY